MMNKRTLTLLATVALSAAGTSFAAAQQGYGAPSPTYSTDPGYPPGGYRTDDPRVAPRGATSMPDFDLLDDEDPRAPHATALPAPGPGPVMSPDDPRYGRPAGAPPVYSDRGPPVIYSDRPAQPPQRPADRGEDDGFSRGLRPPEAIGGSQGNVTGSVPPQGASGPDGRPVQLSALPLEEQPEIAPVQLPPHLRRQEVNFVTKEPAGTLVVDTPNTYLYYVLGNGRAMRYGVRVGRDGFTWTGVQKVSRKAEWPDWHPPTEMIERQPYLPRFMAGGPGNPMGARAMYLGSTIYRIHGTNQPSTIGKFVSSGCIGMLNDDVSDLFERVKVGTRVVVLPGRAPTATTASAQQAPASGNNPPAQQGYQSQQAYSVPGTQPSSVPPLPAPVTVR